MTIQFHWIEIVLIIAYAPENETDYARIIESEWKNSPGRQRVVHNLGRVLDKEKEIYKNRKNRKQGVSGYCLESDSFTPLEEDYTIISEPLAEKKGKSFISVIPASLIHP